MALGDEVKRLQENVATLSERLANLTKTVDFLGGKIEETGRIVADLRREHEKEIALIKQDTENRYNRVKSEQEREIALLNREIEDFRNWKTDQKKQAEEWSRRLWAFGPNLLAAVVGGLIAAAINYFIPR